MHLQKKLSILLIGFFILTNTNLVNAQTNTASGIEEILVTAQRAQENIQDVPIAVSAFSSDSLELQQIDTFGDLQFNAPNITFTRGNFTGSSMAIRGVSSAAVAASGDGAVGYHLDGVPLPTRVFETEYYDVESVEILRGPQGTLFGANSSAGTINLIFGKPTSEFEGSADIEIGDYNHQKITAMVNMPLTSNLKLRASGMALQRDGFSNNMFPGKEGEDIDGRDITSWRFVLEADLSENTTARLTYMDFEEDDNRARAGRQMCKPTEVPSYGCYPNEFGYGQPTGGSTLGGLFAAIGGLGSFSPLDGGANKNPLTSARETYQAMDPVYKASEKLYLLALETRAIENFNIKANFAYHDTLIFTQQDYNNTDGKTKFLKTNPAFPQGIVPISGYTDDASGIFSGAVQGYYDFNFSYDTSRGSTETKYGDIVISSDFEGTVNFTAGVNFIEAETYNNYDVYFASADAAALSPMLSVFRLYPTHYRNLTSPYELERKGAFGQIYFDLSEDTKITLGARWTESEKSIQDVQMLLNSAILAGGTAIGDPVTAAVQTSDPNLMLVLGGLAPPSLAPIPTPGQARSLVGAPSSFTEDEITYKASIDHNLNLAGTDSTLVYASFSRGYRPGAFNPPVDPILFAGVAPQTEPEFIDAIEVGMKNVLFDNTMIANLTAFYYDYQGLQVSKIIARTSVNENIDAEMQGLEAEFFWSPSKIPGLRLDAQFSLLETEVAGGTTSLNPHDLTSRNLGNTEGWVIKDVSNGSTCGFKKSQLQAGLAGGILNPAADLLALPKTLSVDGVTSSDPTGTVDPVAQIFGMGALPTLGRCADISSKLSAAGLGSFYEVPYDLSGKELTNAPAATAHIGIEYTANLSQADLQVVSRLDYYWQDKMYTRLYNTPRDVIDAWDVLNAQVIFQSTVNPWYLKIWGKNLMDDDNQTGAYFTDPSSGQFRNDFFMDPRMIGITFGASF